MFLAEVIIVEHFYLMAEQPFFGVKTKLTPIRKLSSLESIVIYK